MAQKPTATLRATLVKAKGSFPQDAKTDAIYPVPCEGCNAKYNETTCKRFKSRITLHKAAIRNHFMSYLKTLHLDTDQQFAFDETQIIGLAQSRTSRLFPEAIRSDANSINRRVALDYLLDFSHVPYKL